METLRNKPLFCNRQLESPTQKRAHKRNAPNIAAINNEEVVMKRPQRIILKLYLQTFFLNNYNIWVQRKKKQRQKLSTKGEKTKQVKNE